jgi:hypothetical protein
MINNQQFYLKVFRLLFVKLQLSTLTGNRNILCYLMVHTFLHVSAKINHSLVFIPCIIRLIKKNNNMR